MVDNQADFLRQYEDDLMRICLRQATELKYLNGQLFETPDLDNLWSAVAAEYMADAVPNIVSYPSVAVAWASYLGMAYAHLWDADWERLKTQEHPYKYIAGVRGFDLMDEYVTNELIAIGYESEAGQKLEALLRTLSETCINRIKKEQIEPQSKLAFHVFARSVKVMYKIGVSIELYRLGYKYERI